MARNMDFVKFGVDYNYKFLLFWNNKEVMPIIFMTNPLAYATILT